MKLKKNELKIIQLLLASPDYISTYDIATSTGIPRRLVRDEISNVRVILSSLNLNLLSKPSKGYFIEGKSSKDLSRLQNIIMSVMKIMFFQLYQKIVEIILQKD